MVVYVRMLNYSYERACPYCHATLSRRVDADTHIIGCSDRWRQHHHVDPSPAETIVPPEARPWAPAPASPAFTSVDELVRHRVTDPGSHSKGFRSLPPYEPAA